MPTRYSDDDDDEEEEVEEQEQQRQKQKQGGVGGKVTRTLNELLIAALQEAANPGIGDEEPEKLTDPNTEHDPNKIPRAAPAPANSAATADQTTASTMNSTTQEDDSEINRNKMIIEESGDSNSSGSNNSGTSLRERAHFIPLRLTYDERKALRLVTAAIDVSDYTNAVDNASFRSSARRRHAQLQHIVAFLTGIVAAHSYDSGQQVLADRNFLPFQGLLQQVLEIARRYKITNPEKMRSEYGKLVYLMQDAVGDSVQQLLGIHIHTPVHTVYSALLAASFNNSSNSSGLNSSSGTALLDDPLLPVATQEILAVPGKSRQQIQQEIRRKERAAEQLVRKYSSSRLSADSIRLCMYSISDNNSFLNSNKQPVSDCIALLQKYFSPAVVEDGYSLAICEGDDGARISHSHERQYNYVLQSLTLWAAILEDMFRLWYLAEQDLLDATAAATSATTSNNSNSNTNGTSSGTSSGASGGGGCCYELRNTGQGLQRVQQSPRVFRAMQQILANTKAHLSSNSSSGSSSGGWVGSSVVHLGDHNVPNALIFIDKYTQVARILGPLLQCFRSLEAASATDAGLARYLQSHGGLETAIKDVLRDFFRHGFDGSGGDNFFDAGSCIDGRLTSAWNWCSQLAQKPFYPLFRLTGFLSFDGEFDS